MLERIGLTNPEVRRGFILLALMQIAFGFATNGRRGRSFARRGEERAT